MDSHNVNPMNISADSGDRGIRLGDVQVKKNIIMVRGQIIGYSGGLNNVIRFPEEDPIKDVA